MHRFYWLAPLAFFAPALSITAADWPQWQGPERTAISSESGLLASWSEDGPPLVRTITGLGQGYSTPTIADGRVFSMGNRDKTEYVMAYSEKDGKELWATALGDVRAGGGGFPGPRCSPTIDGTQVYALGLNGDLLCLEASSGKILWRKDLRKEFKGRVGGWGYSESPLIDGDWVLCTPGGAFATLLALNKLTGEPVWRGVVPQHDAAHYSSIIAADVDGERQYIQFLNRAVVGFSKDGEFLWRYNRPANGTANCSTPIYSDGHVFAASGYGTGGGLVKLVKEEGQFKPDEIYFTRKMKNHHGGMVLLDGYLYGSDERFLTCLEFKTGKVMWAERKPGKGSIAYADGRLYYRNEDGPMILVEATPEKYHELGRFTPTKRSGKPSWPHPVIANGKLYLRDQDMLHVYDLEK